MADAPVVITLQGEYDIANAPELLDILTMRGGGTPVVADLRQVTFLDSAALSQLVRANSHLNDAGASLTLVLPDSGPVARVMSITQLDTALTTTQSLEQALESLGA
ncbi:MAG: STAS domain-containing protein [Candidatus Nanopelagicales bacterium]